MYSVLSRLITFTVASMLRAAIYCSDWSNCTANAKNAGCTYHDMFTEALQYPSWSDFNDYDLTQQRYRVATDTLSHLCTNIYPGMLLTNLETMTLFRTLRVIRYQCCYTEYLSWTHFVHIVQEAIQKRH